MFPGWYHVTLLSVWFHLSISTCPLRQRPSGRSRSHCELWVSRGFDNYLPTQLLLPECQETHTDHHISVARIFYISVMLGWVESCPISLKEIDFYQRICRKIPCVGCRVLHVSLWCLFWPSLLLVLSRIAWLPATVGVKWPQKKESSNTSSSCRSNLVSSACSPPLDPKIDTQSH